MKAFIDMFTRITASSYYDKMLRYTVPLNDCFGINHFWYFKLTYKGNYSYVGTHVKWSEYCYEHSLLDKFPGICDPQSLQNGILLIKADVEERFAEVLRVAWDKFQINYNINVQRKMSDGIEGFGFATHYNDPKADERIINQLPLLNHFIKNFRKENKKLFQLIDENQVNIASQFGAVAYRKNTASTFSDNRNLYLRKMGLGEFLTLTPREKDVLRYMSRGYPATHIANQLFLSKRTVENYISVIKEKLICPSKVELISLSSEIESLGYFD